MTRDNPRSTDVDDAAVHLAAYDEWLRRGHGPPASDYASAPDNASASNNAAASNNASASNNAAASNNASASEARPRPSEELASCLRLLERAWPRGRAYPALPDIPERIGRFEIKRVLGIGGFGVVYLAQDPVLHRLVALKVPRPHLVADDDLRERFQREARAAAKLDHPHIVPIYETDITSSLGYIAAAYCPGSTLAEWLKERTSPTPIRLAASLVACLADAVHYSHDQGVVHRDIKPGNVILSPLSTDQSSGNDELPFNPRITDFGLAKLRDEGFEQTSISMVLGTPPYMAPEQAGLSPRVVGPPADIHALGVVLYELMVGRPPFIGDSIVEVLDQVRYDEPVAPRRLRPQVPRDLETICLTCLEKSPARRYATAHDLAEDLRRFLAGKPLHARRPGPAVILGKWVRRRPLTATLIATLVIAAVSFSTLLFAHNRRLTRLTGDLNASLFHADRLQRQTDRLRIEAERATQSAKSRGQEAETAKDLAESQERIASRIAYASAIRLANLAWHDGDIRQCRMLLGAAQQRIGFGERGGLEWDFLDYRTREDYRELGDSLRTLFCVAVGPSGHQLAVGGEGGLVHIVDIASGRTTKTLRTDHDDVRGVAFNAAGDRMAVCGEINTVSVWDIVTGTCHFVSPPARAPLKSVAWLLDDQWIAASGNLPNVHLWNVSNGEEASELSTDGETVSSLIATRDGRRVCAGGRNGTVWIWDAATRELADRFGRGSAVVSCLAFSSTNQLLAVGVNSPRVDLYRSDQGHYQFRGEIVLTDDIRGVAFSSRNDQLAVLEQFGTLRLWALGNTVDAAGIQPRFERGWLAHEERGSQLAFLSDGREIVSVGRGLVGLRHWTPSRAESVLAVGIDFPPRGDSLPILFGQDATRLILAHAGPELRATADLKRTAAFGDGLAARETLAVSRDGRWIAAAAIKDNEHDPDDNVIELWDATSDRRQTPRWRLFGVTVDSLSFSPNADLLAGANWTDDCVMLFRRDSGQRLPPLPSLQCHEAVFSPDGLHLAVDDLDDIVIWDTATWRPTTRLKGNLSTILAVAFSPDGHWLATGGRDREIRLWDTRDWKLAYAMPGHRFDITELCWTADSNVLLALDAGHYVKMWDPVTGLGFGDLRSPTDGGAHKIALSPDNRFLAVRLPNDRVELRRLKDD